MPVCMFIFFSRIVKDVPTDSKEGKQVFKQADASQSSYQKTASTFVSILSPLFCLLCLCVSEHVTHKLFSETSL